MGMIVLGKFWGRSFFCILIEFYKLIIPKLGTLSWTHLLLIHTLQKWYWFEEEQILTFWKLECCLYVVTNIHTKKLALLTFLLFFLMANSFNVTFLF